MVFIALVIVFMNKVAEKVTVMVKLIGVSLVLLLTVMSSLALVLWPEISRNDFSDRQVHMISGYSYGFVE